MTNQYTLKRVGLFFGSFNPIHNGHIGVARYFTDNNLLDEVWFVVSPQSPYKKVKNLLDANVRLKMVELAVSEFNKLKACDIEFNMPTPSYSYNTLSKLKTSYPDNDFTVILGSDQISRFQGWKNWQYIVENFNIFFYPRNNEITHKDDNLSELFLQNFNKGIVIRNCKLFADVPKFDISSTEIRNNIANNISVDNMTPPSVWNYIKENDFYKTTNNCQESDENNSFVNILKIFLLTLLFLFSTISYSQFYNGSLMEFGQKKIQYGNFIWSYYQYDNYDIYFYQNGQNLAIDAKKVIDKNYPTIEKSFNTRINDKIKIIIYNTLSDYNQTNLGTLAKTKYNTGGIAYIIDNKIFIYFNGNISNFETQIKTGLYKVVINNAMQNSKLAAMIKNSDETNDWFVDGLAAYYSENWNTDLDNRFRSLIESGKIKKLKSVDNNYAVLAGHSVWKYIADFYGLNMPLEVFNAAIKLSNPYDSFERILGLSFKELDKAWKNYYTNLYKNYPNDIDDDRKNIIANRKNKTLTISNIKYSPDGKFITYLTNDNGLKKLFILNMQTGKKLRVYKTGYRSYNKIDETFPITAWHPNSTTLAVATEEKGGVKLFFYDVNTGNLFFPSNISFSSLSFQKITDLAYSPDAKYIIMSAVKNGQSDIFLWNIVSGVSKQLTNDIYNDFNPRFIDEHGNIIFSSNRYCDSKNIRPNNDLYKLNINTPYYITRLTESKNTDEIKPRKINENKIVYLSDENGIYNLYIAKFDSIISFVDTVTHYNYYIKSKHLTENGTSILDYDILGNKIAQVTLNKNKYSISEKIIYNMLNDNITNDDEDKQNKTYYKNSELVNDSILTNSKTISEKKLSFFNVTKKDNRADIPTRNLILKIKQDIDTVNNNHLISKFEMNNGVSGKETERDKWKTYSPEFFINTLITQIDFTSMDNSYQQYTGGTSPVYLYKGFNVLAGAGITDLMEDYRISGAFSLGTDLINNEYAVSFSNLKHRLDREFIFHRFTDVNELDNYGYNTQKQRTQEFIYKLTWPFTEFFYASGSLIVKNNRIITTDITDITSIAKPDTKSNWAGLLGELVFDNSYKICQNIMLGTRFKIFGEYDQLIVKDNRNMVVLGFDFRNYQRIHREIIFAWRVAGSTSLGSDRLIYYMGGVDNWIIPSYNYDNQPSTEINYAYQTLATNMRGFPQNTRNGPNFVVLNTEIRFPFVRYFAQKPLKSKFLNSLQIIGFCDAGSAWNGLDPYSEENALFKKTYKQTPMYIEVTEHKEPFIVGYGVGLRASILGYFIRADYGWGFEDGTVAHHELSVSLSLDF